MAETAWSLVPPVITIVLALVTKEVYMSLAIGIFIGAFMFTGFNFLGAIDTMFDIMSNKVGGNVNILVFLVLLGIIVSAIQKSGASQAYGNYAARKINGKRSALLVTFFLGLLIFIDDYFNCLTVGTVMRPVTDKFKITRAKLAYIIDATAAPICIIAPVSSWAAAVSSSLPENSGIDGFSLFLHTIPLNLYAWLTIIFMLFIIFLNKDFSRMAAFEKESGSTLVIPAEYADNESTAPVGNGRIMDLVFPLLVLIGSCIFGMLYTGGILEGKSVIDAFAECNSAKGLVMGSFMALVFTLILYVPRKILDFTTFCSCFVDGFKQMASAIFILCLAWTLSGVCGESYLNIGGYVGGVVSGSGHAPCDVLPCGAWSCFCNGYFLGDVWYFDSYCSCNHGNKYESGNDDGCRCFSRGCRRRPCISDFRYYNPCFRRSAVQPYRPCVYTDSLCTLCFFLLRSRLYCGRRNGRRPLGNFFRYHSADTYDGRNLQV